MLNTLIKYNLRQKIYKCLGRGKGSGKGKTSGRGHKGQKSRSGGFSRTRIFEGGQTPFFRSIPKRGMKSSSYFTPATLIRSIHLSNKNNIHCPCLLTYNFHENKYFSITKERIKLVSNSVNTLQLILEVNTITRVNIKHICNYGSIITIV